MTLHRTGTVDLGDNNDPLNSSGSQAWGKLVPISQGLATQQLKSLNITIGRNNQVNIQIQDKRLSGKHCQIIKTDKKVQLTDLSVNGTFVKDAKIGKGKTIQLNDKDEIWLLPASKVPINETIGFRIEFIESKPQQPKKVQQPKQIQQPKKVEQSKQKKQQQKKLTDYTSSLKDQITCSYCLEIMFIPVIVQPCNHRFCGACLTQLVNAKKEQCITCRKTVTTGVRDSIFNSIVEDYLKMHPDGKRTKDEQQQARKNNIFGHDPIDIQQKIHGKKVQPVKTKATEQKPSRGRGRGRVARKGSDISASDDDDDGTNRCRQCAVSRNGFQCSKDQVHVACHTCGKLMANREDQALHQYCVICTTNHCNLYYPPCSRAGVKLELLKNKRGTVKIDAQLLRGNKFQFEAIKNYLLSIKSTSKEVFDYMMKQIQRKKFVYLFDRKVMKVAPLLAKQVELNQDSSVCDHCWKDLWFQMVLGYRHSEASKFPTGIKDRPICYWGVNCRTMDHNEDHAKRFSHMVFQSRFS